MIDLRPAVRFREWPEPKRGRSKKTAEPGQSRELDDGTGPLPLAEMFDPRRQFACRSITVRHADHHQAVAAILWVTGQDKATPYRFRGLLDTAIAALTRGIHLLVIDLFPPVPNNSDGFHQLLARELGDAAADVPTNRRLAVASYRSHGGVDAIVEPLAVGARCRRCRCSSNRASTSRARWRRATKPPGTRCRSSCGKWCSVTARSSHRSF